MKWQALLAICAILVCAALGLFVYKKHEEGVNLFKSSSFLEVKARVSTEVLSEYLADVTALQDELNNRKKEVEELEKVVEKAQVDYNNKKAPLDTCTGDKKRITDEAAAMEGETKHFQEVFPGEKGKWTQETDNLRKQLAEYSILCNFVEKTSEEGMKLCGKTPEAAPKVENPQPAAQQ